MPRSLNRMLANTPPLTKTIRVTMSRIFHLRFTRMALPSSYRRTIGAVCSVNCIVAEPRWARPDPAGSEAAGGRRQAAEGRRQAAEGRRQAAEGRRQAAEGRRQKAGIQNSGADASRLGSQKEGAV